MSPRHVGRVVDPLVRGDGGDEPEITLDPSVDTDDAVAGIQVAQRIISKDEPSPSGHSEDDAFAFQSAAGHPVRNRLLARAAEARLHDREEQAEQTSRASERSFTEELERVASRRAPPSSTLVVTPNRRDLPPNVIVLFGTLFGLALLAALFAVLIHVDPRDGSPIVGAPPLARSSALVAPTVSPDMPLVSPLVKKPERTHVQGPWRIADSTDPHLKKVEGTIGHASFLKAIEDAGVPHADTFRILQVMESLRDLNHCNPRDRFLALVDRRSNHVTAFEYVVSKEEIYQAREGLDGFLKSAKLDLQVARNRIQGAIRFDRDTFVESVEAAGFEPQLVSVIDEAMAGHASVADLKHGDRLRVVAQEVTVLGDFDRYAGIEALEVVPGHGDQKPLRIYYFQGPKSHGYFDADGRSVHEGEWKKPIPGAVVTSPFNLKRMHPILHTIMPHQGTDFRAPMGTPVGASAAGIVKFMGNGGPSGNLVVIQHPGGIETGYAHLSKFEPGLKVGDTVTAMQIVGLSGSTGRSTGPHLHFSVKLNGVFVDPMKTLGFDSLRGMPLDEKLLFTDERTKLDVLLDAIALPPPVMDTPAAAHSPNPPQTVADETEFPSPTASGVPSPASAAVARVAAPPTAPATGSSASPARAASIYLSDQELLKEQGATDNGEVDE